MAGDGYPKDIETADPDDYDTDTDDSFRQGMMERLSLRLPEFGARAEIVRGYASLYDVTPDWHPIIGNDPDVGGFVHCEGFSGHGFKLGPAVGKVVAETILDGQASTVDIRAVESRTVQPGRHACGQLRRQPGLRGAAGTGQRTSFAPAGVRYVQRLSRAFLSVNRREGRGFNHVRRVARRFF